MEFAQLLAGAPPRRVQKFEPSDLRAKSCLSVVAPELSRRLETVPFYQLSTGAESTLCDPVSLRSTRKIAKEIAEKPSETSQEVAVPCVHCRVLAYQSPLPMGGWATIAADVRCGFGFESRSART